MIEGGHSVRLFGFQAITQAKPTGARLAGASSHCRHAMFRAVHDQRDVISCMVSRAVSVSTNWPVCIDLTAVRYFPELT